MRVNVDCSLLEFAHSFKRCVKFEWKSSFNFFLIKSGQKSNVTTFIKSVLVSVLFMMVT